MTDGIIIEPPLRGEWKILRPPGHHPDAFDFVQMDKKRRSTHLKTGLQSIISRIPSQVYYCWGKPVYAPADGTVLYVGDGWSDNQSTSFWKTIRLWYSATFTFRPKLENGRLDIRPNAGNYVMILASGGYIVFLAHLRNHSIVVSEGSVIKTGELIGEVGNSGNSTMPHLHLNLFDQMGDPFSAKVLPFVFSKYALRIDETGWVEQVASRPSPGNIISFV